MVECARQPVIVRSKMEIAATSRLTRLNQRGLLIAWFVVCLAVICGSQLCSTIWAFANPAPHHWDNADYLNLAYNDMWSYKFGGPENHLPGFVGVWDSLINADHNRPPGYRFVSLPFVFSGVSMLPMLRAVSLGFFGLTLIIIYHTVAIAVEGPAGKIAGLIAAALVSIYLEIGWSIRLYGTEYTLYFSIALMLWCLARSTQQSGKGAITWIALGLALGLGVLSKLSFVLMAAPAGAVALVLVLLRRLPGLSVWKLIAAFGIGCAMARPFYRYHIFEALHYGQDMLQFKRHSLNQTGWTLLRSWFRLHQNEGLGLRAGWLLALFTFVGALKYSWRSLLKSRAELHPPQSEEHTKRPLNPPQITTLFALAAGLPLPLFQLVYSHSDNVRHMTPAYLPLTVAIVIAAAWALTSIASWGLLLVFAWLSFVQVNREFIPLTNTPDDVWNWDPLYQLCQTRHLRWPYIGRVGNAGQFCEPSIVYPWMKRGDWANCTWLWRSEEGTFDWKKVNEKLADRDVVLTAPGFHLPPENSMLADPLEQDNSHNDEFEQHMTANPQWELAEKFPIGVINQTQIWVFIRKVPIKR